MLCTQRQDQAGEGTPCLAVEPSAALLLVEDEVHSCSRLHRLLTPHGLAVTGASSTMTVGTVATASFAYAVIEMRLGDDSLELIQTLRERHACMRIVVVTYVDSFATAILAPRRCCDDIGRSRWRGGAGGRPVRSQAGAAAGTRDAARGRTHAPGGVEAMAALAPALQLDPAFVGAHHVPRSLGPCFSAGPSPGPPGLHPGHLICLGDLVLAGRDGSRLLSQRRAAAAAPPAALQAGPGRAGCWRGRRRHGRSALAPPPSRRRCGRSRSRSGRCSIRRARP
jgi:CheY-like chemotaxis protein